MESVEKYGWNDVSHPNSCNYLGKEIIRELKEIRPKNILDLGCGNGALCDLMKSEFNHMEIVGVDYDKQGIELANKHYPSIDFYNYGVQDDPDALLDKTEGLFDVVVSTEVIEHLYAPQLLPAYANRVLKKGGKLIITTPYHGYLKNLSLSILNKWDSHLDPFWDGGHIKFWSKSTLTKLLKNNGFEILEFRGVGRVSFLWKSMLIVCQKR
ncbi:MAG: class I SAM-dependent methyltransferase [Candidatus Peribacteraceae bacterium]|nr:class I SAM-dependent methyltransferase [Candidatus Peribacteraceae bacterium]